MTELVQVIWPLPPKDVITKSAPNPADTKLPLMSNEMIYFIMQEPLSVNGHTGSKGANLRTQSAKT